MGDAQTCPLHSALRSRICGQGKRMNALATANAGTITEGVVQNKHPQGVSVVRDSSVEERGVWGSSYLHVPLAHHNLSRVSVLHQLLQGLRVDVMQRHMRLAALAHLIWGNTDTGHDQRPTAGLFPQRDA